MESQRTVCTKTEFIHVHFPAGKVAKSKSLCINVLFTQKKLEIYSLLRGKKWGLITWNIDY